MNEAESHDEESERGGPEPLATVLRRAFASWVGSTCSTCDMPALLHGARCDDGKRLPVDVLQRDPLTGDCSPAGDARHASSSLSHEENR